VLKYGLLHLKHGDNEEYNILVGKSRVSAVSCTFAFTPLLVLEAVLMSFSVLVFPP
jgi:hypothetical protein